MLNIFNDVVEMLKGAVTHYNAESLTVVTTMYGIKTEYVFRVIRSPEESLVIVETKDEREDDKQSIELMFAIMENMLASYEEQITLKDSGRTEDETM
jgi:uncharacterized protein YsxB (DUF464 family)